MKLGELATFTSGELISRIQEHGDIDNDAGDYELFNPDRTAIRYLHTEDELNSVTDDQLILGLIQQAVYLHPKTPCKLLLTANFAAIHPDEKIDMMFLAWWFNYSHEARRQRYQMAQRTISAMNRLTLQDVKRMNIHLPTLEQQQQIGHVYRNQLETVSLLERRTQLIEQRSLALMNQLWGKYHG